MCLKEHSDENHGQLSKDELARGSLHCLLLLGSMERLIGLISVGLLRCSASARANDMSCWRAGNAKALNSSTSDDLMHSTNRPSIRTG